MSINPPRHLLVLRLGSLGDVLLTLPVLYEVLQNHESLRIYVLTKPAFAPLFTTLPRTTILRADTDGVHQGLLGLYRLAQYIHKEYPEIDAVADLHAVLRTFVLKIFFVLRGIRFLSISKYRTRKKAFLKHQVASLLPVTKVYEEVFNRYGLFITKPYVLDFDKVVGEKSPHLLDLLQKYSFVGATIIAPFAAFEEKTYPIHKTEKIVSLLSKQGSGVIFLFGKGKKEESILRSWQSLYPRTYYIEGCSLVEEIYLMSLCARALVMDSANLHLAGLARVRHIVCLWGATSPQGGFAIWKGMVNLYQSLSCQPCSIFGSKPCRRGDYLCMQSISSDEVWKALSVHTKFF